MIYNLFKDYTLKQRTIYFVICILIFTGFTILMFFRTDYFILTAITSTAFISFFSYFVCYKYNKKLYIKLLIPLSIMILLTTFTIIVNYCGYFELMLISINVYIIGCLCSGSFYFFIIELRNKIY